MQPGPRTQRGLVPCQTQFSRHEPTVNTANTPMNDASTAQIWRGFKIKWVCTQSSTTHHHIMEDYKYLFKVKIIQFPISVSSFSVSPFQQWIMDPSTRHAPGFLMCWCVENTSEFWIPSSSCTPCELLSAGDMTLCPERWELNIYSISQCPPSVRYTDPCRI